MKALVYHGPGRHSWEEFAEPEIQQPTDAVVRVDAVTVCGTDLHILKGDVPEVTSGRVLGHEAVGTVEKVGAAVTGIGPGDKVLISCISPCGRCRNCRSGMYGQCSGGGGWILGHLVDGTQAERVRVPFADNSLHLLPQGIGDEAALMLADIIPTSYEVGILKSHLSPGESLVVVGAGPIGLAAVTMARLFSPSRIVVVDPAARRREKALELGATVCLAPDQNLASEIVELLDGLGADVALEAVGTPGTFELCTQIVRPGGRVANVGVHGAPAELHLEALWSRNITITTGLVDTWSTPKLLDMLRDGQIATTGLVTHRFGIHEMLDAYDVFSAAAENDALKVALFRT